MKKELVITLVLVALVVIGLYGSYQISEIKSSVQGSSVVNSPAAGPSSGSSGAVPSNIQNLPDMVGGC